ncbi:uncharacterized protein [Periplaneta americana]|uniref:uncharacterized protein isoform X3 n=1 Tax=Periplaneta americana TaxID=6978 RepID=UPI0037E8F2EE
MSLGVTEDYTSQKSGVTHRASWYSPALMLHAADTEVRPHEEEEKQIEDYTSQKSGVSHRASRYSPALMLQAADTGVCPHEEEEKQIVSLGVTEDYTSQKSGVSHRASQYSPAPLAAASLSASYSQLFLTILEIIYKLPCSVFRIKGSNF